MSEIRWGVMGAGTIAYRFADALEHVGGARLVAVSGRNAARVVAFAERHPVAPGRCYVSGGDGGAAAHERLVSDADVDAVYLALPHGLHAEWACKLLHAGKAVLCEKPAALSEDEALRIATAARDSGSLFVEAMKPRFTPVREHVKRLLDGGELGRIVSIDVAHRLAYGDQRGRYLLDPVQGGTLYDLGCYGVAWVEDLLAGEIEDVHARVRWVAGNDGSAVDIADEVHASVGGVPVHLDFAGDSEEYRVQCAVRCERGDIVIPMFHRPSSLVLRRDGVEEVLDLPLEVDDFYGEVAHVCELIRAGASESPVMPLDATVRCARIIDVIRGAWPDPVLCDERAGAGGVEKAPACG